MESDHVAVQVESSSSSVVSEWQKSPVAVRFSARLVDRAERLPLATGRAWGRLLVVEEHRYPGLAELPGEVVREHAEEEVA